MSCSVHGLHLPGVEHAGRPAGEETEIFAATWPPGEAFREPVQVSDRSHNAWVQQAGLGVGREGRPVALLWEAERANSQEEAIFYSELPTGGSLVYVPLGLYQSP